MRLIVCSNDRAPLNVRHIYSSSKLRTAQMMIFSLVVMMGFEKLYITSAYLQWLYPLGERAYNFSHLLLVPWHIKYAMGVFSR